MIIRRSLLTGLVGLVAAPAVVKADNLMNISAIYDDVWVDGLFNKYKEGICLTMTSPVVKKRWSRPGGIYMPNNRREEAAIQSYWKKKNDEHSMETKTFYAGSFMWKGKFAAPKSGEVIVLQEQDWLKINDIL